jgi:hypothetical protein
MNTFKDIFQKISAVNTSILVISYLHMNPPTEGHSYIINTVVEQAKLNGTGYKIFVSDKHDGSRFPMDIHQKMYWVNLFFPFVTFTPVLDGSRTIVDIVSKLKDQVKHLIVVTGSNTASDTQQLLDKYNSGKHFESIRVVSSGTQDPEFEASTQLTSAKLITVAKANDFMAVKSHVPSTLTDSNIRKFIMSIRSAIGIKNTVQETIQISKTRDMFYRGEQFLIGQVVKESDKLFEIVDRGTNYITVVDENGTLSKKFIDKLTVVESTMNYRTGSIYKGFIPSDAFKSVPNLLEAVDSITDEDPVAVLKSLNLIEQFLSSEIDNLDRVYEIHERIGISKSFDPILESLSEKPVVKPSDKLNIARIIADALGADTKSSDADMMVNSALRGIKSRKLDQLTTDTISKMLKTAREVGIKIDQDLVPRGISESESDLYTIDPNMISYDANIEGVPYDVLKQQLIKHVTLRQSNEIDVHPSSNKSGYTLDANDLLRKMKVRKMRDI